MKSVPYSGVRVVLKAAPVMVLAVLMSGCASFFEPEPQAYGSLKDPPAGRARAHATSPVRRVADVGPPRATVKIASQPAPSAKVAAEPAPAPAPKVSVVEPRTETTATTTLSSAPAFVPKNEPLVIESKPVSPIEPTKSEPASTPAAPPQQVAVATPVSREEIDDSTRILTEGRQLFLSGKVVEARRRFITAMTGNVDAILALARSYDLNYLSDLQTSDAGPDQQRAVALYQRAAAQGSVEAKGDLDRIAALGKAKP